MQKMVERITGNISGNYGQLRVQVFLAETHFITVCIHVLREESGGHWASLVFVYVSFCPSPWLLVKCDSRLRYDEQQLQGSQRWPECDSLHIVCINQLEMYFISGQHCFGFGGIVLHLFRHELQISVWVERETNCFFWVLRKQSSSRKMWHLMLGIVFNYIAISTLGQRLQSRKCWNSLEAVTVLHPRTGHADVGLPHFPPPCDLPIQSNTAASCQGFL